MFSLLFVEISRLIHSFLQIVGSIAISPVDLIKVRLQVNRDTVPSIHRYQVDFDIEFEIFIIRERRN